MKNSVIIRIVCWSIVALLLLGLLIAGVNGRFSCRNREFSFLNGLGNGESAYHSYDASGYAPISSGSVNAAEITGIDIEWVAGRVDVVAGDVDAITFTETSAYELSDSQKMQYAVRNGRLYIQYCAPRAAFNWSGFAGKSLLVTIPRDHALTDFDLEAASAAVVIDTLSAQTVDLDLVSGKTELSNIQCTELSLQGVSGKMELSAITAEKLEIEGVSGTVEVAGSDCHFVSASMVSGNLRIEPGKDIQELTVDTVSGTVRVALPENDGFTAHYSTASGNLHTGFPVEMRGRRTAIYNGGGAELSFSSASGNVYIEKIN